MATPSPWLPTAVALLLLAAIATTGLIGFRIPRPAAVVSALARAGLQLALLSLILSSIINDPWLVALGLSVMFAAAVFTAARRSRRPVRRVGPLAAAMLAGPLAIGVVVFSTGAIEFSPRYVLAIGGIVIGNTMTIAILTERIFASDVLAHWPEVEGWLALGATARQSTLSLARAAIQTALLPSVDQTRTTGIVVLPGAFVGAIFAGASPVEAARFQLVVLASVLAAGVLTSTLLLRLTGAVAQRPEDPAAETKSSAAR